MWSSVVPAVPWIVWAEVPEIAAARSSESIDLAVPEQSLLLRKMSGQMPHGGGARIPAGSEDYETLRAWLAAGKGEPYRRGRVQSD